jgi:hypothetical protein
MGRFDTLMYDNRNWKGTIALVASMLIGLAVGYKGFDQLPDLQNDHRAASVTLLKARRVLDKQSVTTPNYGKAWMQVQMAENRVRAADVGIYLANITFGLGLIILGISLVVYLRRAQGLAIQFIQSAEPAQPHSATPRLAA